MIPKSTNSILALRGKSFCEVRLDLKIHDPMLASVTRKDTSGYIRTVDIRLEELSISASSLNDYRCGYLDHWIITKNILRIFFFHFVIVPLMLSAPLIFDLHARLLLICFCYLAKHITTPSSSYYSVKLICKTIKLVVSISLFLASEDLPAHLRC